MITLNNKSGNGTQWIISIISLITITITTVYIKHVLHTIVRFCAVYIEHAFNQTILLTPYYNLWGYLFNRTCAYVCASACVRVFISMSALRIVGPRIRSQFDANRIEWTTWNNISRAFRALRNLRPIWCPYGRNWAPWFSKQPVGLVRRRRLRQPGRVGGCTRARWSVGRWAFFGVDLDGGYPTDAPA